MEMSRQEHWDLPEPGIKPTSTALQTDSLPLSHRGSHSLPNVGYLAVACGILIAD